MQLKGEAIARAKELHICVLSGTKMREDVGNSLRIRETL